MPKVKINKEKRPVKEIRDALIIHLETEGPDTTNVLKEKIGKALDISGEEVEKNLLFLQTKEKLNQKSVGKQQLWFVTEPTKEKAVSPKDYKEYKRKLVFITPCLGTFPIQTAYWLDEIEKAKLMKEYSYDGKTPLQIHEQRRCDGKHYILSGWLRGALRDSMYLLPDKYKTLAQQHLKIWDAEIHPVNGMKIVTRHVSVRGGTQGGITRFEGIIPGAWADISIKYPSNMITEEEMDSLLSDVGQSRGLGGGHSEGYGKFEIQKNE